jgi:choline dehydrogenase-like flavoprotein
MIKLADAGQGSISTARLDKTLTQGDRQRLRQGVGICTEVLARCGANPDDEFLGTLNAGHPGGMLPLTAADAETLHPARLPANLYVADASLLPRSLGNPPILTIVALAKRVSRIVSDL